MNAIRTPQGTYEVQQDGKTLGWIDPERTLDPDTRTLALRFQAKPVSGSPKSCPNLRQAVNHIASTYN